MDQMERYTELNGALAADGPAKPDAPLPNPFTAVHAEFEGMDELIPIGRASKRMGVSSQALALWDARGKLIPAHRSPRGKRYYTMRQIVENLVTRGKMCPHCLKPLLLSKSGGRMDD